MEDNAHTSHLFTTTDNTSIATVSTLLDGDRRVMMLEVKEASGIPKTTIHHILTEYLMKKKVVAWWVPYMLFPTKK